MEAERAKLPKYYAIKKTILDDIKSGVLRKGEILPSEKMLQDKFGVSRITIKRALDELASEGYLYRVQGKGTIVKANEAKAIPFTKKVISCSEEIRSINMTPSRKQIIKSVEACGLAVAQALHLNVGDPVLHFARIYYANDIPINFSDGYISLADMKGLEMFDLENNSLTYLMQDYFHLKMEMISGEADAILAKGELMQYLEVKEGFPLIKLDVIIGNEEKQKYYEMVTSYYRTDLLKISIL